MRSPQRQFVGARELLLSPTCCLFTIKLYMGDVTSLRCTDGPLVPFPLLESVLLRLHEETEEIQTETNEDPSFQQRQTLSQVINDGSINETTSAPLPNVAQKIPTLQGELFAAITTRLSAIRRFGHVRHRFSVLLLCIRPRIKVIAHGLKS